MTEEEEEDVRIYWMALRKRGYWKLKEEVQDDTLWRTRFGRDCGPAA